MAQNRYPAFPSRMQLQAFKNRTKGAKKGHSLLKRKADALKARLNQIVKEIYLTKLQMNDVMKNAHFSHTAARHAAGDFNAKVISKSETATTKIGCFTENIVGVSILKFEKVTTGSNEESLLGLSRGGTQIRKCTESFSKALELLVKLASLQTSFIELDTAMKVTNRRVQALDNVVIPRLENTMRYIASELDEREREDLYRLKKVVQKKREEAKIREELRFANQEDYNGEPASSILEQYDVYEDPDEDILGEL